jgi:UDP-2-acetamido-3-amino-2,3-dideoxy-glucuronate N-acetyltransferase
VFRIRPCRGDNHALSSLTPSNLAPNLLIAAGVELGAELEIGANVVIHDGVSVGAGAQIDHGVVLGRVARFNRTSHTSAPQAGPTLVGAGAIVCPYALVSAGARIEAGAFVGDHTSIRERATIGVDAAVGSFCVISREVELGARVRLQSHCGIGPGVVIEADVFLGPAVRILTGRTMSSPPRAATPVLRRGCQIGAGARILPGVEIGEEAVVGAGAVVVADVPAGATVRGVPARLP